MDPRDCASDENCVEMDDGQTDSERRSVRLINGEMEERGGEKMRKRRREKMVRENEEAMRYEMRSAEH